MGFTWVNMFISNETGQFGLCELGQVMTYKFVTMQSSLRVKDSYSVTNFC